MVNNEIRLREGDGHPKTNKENMIGPQ